MPNIGPTYCETLIASVPGSFPIELVNTFSSLIPAVLGLLALFILHRKRELSVATSILIFFLIAVGVGSTLWHGFRTPLTLSLDVIPGLLYFISLVYFWPSLLFNRFVGYATIIVLFLAQFLAARIGVFGDSNGPPISLFIITAVVGSVFCYLTYKKRGKAVYWACGAVVSAALAAFFRTTDLDTCATISFGTHFLWHAFLGFAAFCGIMLVSKLQKKD